MSARLGLMATSPEELARAAGVALIEDDDGDVVPVDEWLARLERREAVELTEPAAVVLERLRADGEA